jgi:hypothetical protein
LGCITNPHILFNEHGIFDSSFYIITNVWIVHMFICLDCNKQYPIVVVVNFVCYKKKYANFKIKYIFKYRYYILHEIIYEDIKRLFSDIL